MATITATNPRWRYNQNSDLKPAKQRRLVDGSATYKAGQWCYGANDGLMYAAASDAVDVSHFAAENLDTAIGNDTTYKWFYRIRPGDVFEMSVYHTTASSAVIAEADVGERFAIRVATNIVTVDLEDTTNDCVQIVAPSWRDDDTNNTSADTNARCLAVVLDAVVDAEA